MERNSISTSMGSTRKGAPTGTFWQTLRTDRRVGFLDLALATTVILLIGTDATLFLFHVIFLLLTVGAFYWAFSGFVLHASIWMTLTSAVALVKILSGDLPGEELWDIPVLTIILIVVFAIGKQRAKAEDALRKAHDELELRVSERTAALAESKRELEDEFAQHKRTAETLRESEERYRLLVELSFEAVAIYSAGKLVYVNPAGAKLLGALTSVELIGRPLRELVHPDYWEIVHERMQRVLGKGEGVPPLEQKLIRLDGSSVDVEVAAIPIVHNGQPAVQAVIRDISARKQAETARQRERARIARDLHDSLGHSLGYLHLKLDQLAESEDLGEVTKLRQEVARMRDVVNQAYEIVRGMLATLHPSNADDLATALLGLAQAAGQRAGFEVQFSSAGPASAVHSLVQQQILYLFQEALNNVAKHANAQQADIDLSWTEDALTVKLTDDGCGFEVRELELDGHYGLRIMQQRAAEIEGQFTCNSQPGGGTQITLRLPLSPKLQRVQER